MDPHAARRLERGPTPLCCVAADVLTAARRASLAASRQPVLGASLNAARRAIPALRLHLRCGPLQPGGRARADLQSLQ
eukprot:4004687-Prymnesium_polylepis.2